VVVRLAVVRVARVVATAGLTSAALAVAGRRVVVATAARAVDLRAGPVLRAAVWVDVLAFFVGATGGVVVAEKELEPKRESIAVRDRKEYRIPEYVFIVRPTAETLARAMARLRTSGGEIGRAHV